MAKDFCARFAPNSRSTARDLRVLIIGSGGGTGRAVAWQCALENCERLVLVNRTFEKANALAERLRSFSMEARV